MSMMNNSSIVMESEEEDNQRSTRFSNFELRPIIESTETVTNSFVETQVYVEFKIKHILRRMLCDDPYDEVYSETYPDPPVMFRLQLEFRNLFSVQVLSELLHLQLADELLCTGIVPSCRWYEFIERISVDIRKLAEFAVRVKPREIGLMVEVEAVKKEDYNEYLFRKYDAIASEEFLTLDDDDEDNVHTIQASFEFLDLNDDEQVFVPYVHVSTGDSIDDQASIELVYLDDDEVNVPDVAASQASIDALETMKFDRLIHAGDNTEMMNTNTSCPICLDEYSDGVKFTKMSCSHMFHTRCINEWLEKRNTCPLCRLPVL